MLFIFWGSKATSFLKQPLRLSLPACLVLCCSSVGKAMQFFQILNPCAKQSRYYFTVCQGTRVMIFILSFSWELDEYDLLILKLVFGVLGHLMDDDYMRWWCCRAVGTVTAGKKEAGEIAETAETKTSTAVVTVTKHQRWVNVHAFTYFKKFLLFILIWSNCECLLRLAL